MQAAILAGGLGTRLRTLTLRVPKPMVPVIGRPFLEYEIELLKRNGIDDFVLCVGYLGKKVESYFGNGSKWAVRIRYSYDGPKLMGPAGALKRAEPLLEESFFVTYGDAYLQLDYGNVMRTLLDSGRLGLMTAYRNRNRYGKSDLVIKGEYVVGYDKGEHTSGMEWVNFGVTALRKRALALVPPGKEYSEEEFYRQLISRGELLAFPVKERFYEIGSLQSLREFERFIRSQV